MTTITNKDGTVIDGENISYGELATLTHETQVALFNFCACEDRGDNPPPYDDCPNQDVKCASPDCDEMLNDSTDQFWSEITGGSHCIGCYESDMEGASTLLHIDGSGNQIKAIIGDLFIVGQYDMEEPEWMSDLHDGEWKGRVYTRTDSWHGHYDTEQSFDKCTVLTTGWTTGWADDTTYRKLDFNQFIEDLQSGEISAPHSIYILVEPLGNFSVSVSLLVLTEHSETMTTWLDEIGHSVGTLESQLG